MNPSRQSAERPRAGDEPASGVARLIPPGLDAILVLLRHGQTQFIVEKRFQGAMEAPLTAFGETQARRTAELAVAEMNAAGRPTPPLRSDAGFCEIGQGEWEGLTDVQITARFGDSLAGWRRWPTRFHASGGENLESVQARAEIALTRLLSDLGAASPPGTHDRNQVLGYGDDAPDQRPWSLLVAHGGIFKVVVCVLLGLPMEHFWNFDFGLGAITVVEIRAGRAVLRTLNFESHLGGDEQRTAEDSGRNASGAL